MAKAFFSRKVDMFLLPEDTHPDLLFDAYPVEVEEDMLDVAVAYREVVAEMQELFDSNPAPEDSAQAEADALTEKFNGK